MKKLMLFVGAAFFAAGAWAQEVTTTIEYGRLRPGPDEGGMLPESVRNEVEVAIERGLASLVGVQAKDGSFGATNKLFYTLVVGSMLEQRKMREPADNAVRWLLKQQAADGGFGVRDRFICTATAAAWLNMRANENETEAMERAKKWVEKYLVGETEEQDDDDDEEGEFALGVVDALVLVDKTDVGWREKLAKKLLAAQVVKGGRGGWRARDVPEIKIEKGMLVVGNPGEMNVDKTENGTSVAPAGFALPRAVKDASSPLSDFEATVFVLLQLLDL